MFTYQEKDGWFLQILQSMKFNKIVFDAHANKLISYYNSSSVCLCVCLFVCLFVPYVLRGPLTDLRQTWWVYVGGPPICPWRVLFRKGQRLDRVNGSLSLSTILYMPQPHATQQQRCLLLGKQQSLIRRLLLSCMSTTYVGGPGNCYWGVLFLKGQQVDGSTGQTGQRGSLSLSLYYIWYQTMPGSRHPAAKSTRRMMTPASRHTAAKSTQCLLLAWRVNFLVAKNTDEVICLIEWREISMKQPVGKCKQINF